MRGRCAPAERIGKRAAGGAHRGLAVGHAEARLCSGAHQRDAQCAGRGHGGLGCGCASERIGGCHRVRARSHAVQLCVGLYRCAAPGVGVWRRAAVRNRQRATVLVATGRLCCAADADGDRRCRLVDHRAHLGGATVGIDHRAGVRTGGKTGGRRCALHGRGVPIVGIGCSAAGRVHRGRTVRAAGAGNVLLAADRCSEGSGRTGDGHRHGSGATVRIGDGAGVGAGGQCAGRCARLDRSGVPAQCVGRCSAAHIHRGAAGGIAEAVHVGGGCRGPGKCCGRLGDGHVHGRDRAVGIGDGAGVHARDKAVGRGAVLRRRRVPRIAVAGRSTACVNRGAAGGIAEAVHVALGTKAHAQRAQRLRDGRRGVRGTAVRIGDHHIVHACCQAGRRRPVLAVAPSVGVGGGALLGGHGGTAGALAEDAHVGLCRDGRGQCCVRLCDGGRARGGAAVRIGDGAGVCAGRKPDGGGTALHRCGVPCVGVGRGTAGHVHAALAVGTAEAAYGCGPRGRSGQQGGLVQRDRGGAGATVRVRAGQRVGAGHQCGKVEAVGGERSWAGPRVGVRGGATVHRGVDHTGRTAVAGDVPATGHGGSGGACAVGGRCFKQVGGRGPATVRIGEREHVGACSQRADVLIAAAEAAGAGPCKRVGRGAAADHLVDAAIGGAGTAHLPTARVGAGGSADREQTRLRDRKALARATAVRIGHGQGVGAGEKSADVLSGGCVAARTAPSVRVGAGAAGDVRAHGTIRRTTAGGRGHSAEDGQGGRRLRDGGADGGGATVRIRYRA